jgi:protein SCO1/2
MSLPKYLSLVLVLVLLVTGSALAYPEAPDYVSSNSQLLQKAGVDQKLNNLVPLDTTFRDSTGATVKLGQYFQPGKPVILSLVYYSCNMLCPMTLDGITKSLKELNTTAGKDFNVVFVSFNPKETPEIAAAKKLEYTTEYNRPGTEAGWHFLTGDEVNINRLADAVGFRYFFDMRTQQYGHASAIMLLTPDGHVSRYFYGLEYAPEDLRLGLVEASHGKIGSLADAILLLCCRYDPTTGKYGLMVTRMLSIGGGATILAVGSMIGFFVIRDKNKRPLKTGDGTSVSLQS